MTVRLLFHQIYIIGVPQVRVGIVGPAMQLVDNHTHFCAILIHVTVKIALGFTLCNYLTVTGTIILELRSNVCDCLYTNGQAVRYYLIHEQSQPVAIVSTIMLITQP